jgi:WD40 repeat protein
VTCVQFKPTNDNYFISGFIDGMVRIWDISRCQVVDRADNKEIVTALFYCPDGKVLSNILAVTHFHQMLICWYAWKLKFCTYADLTSGCSGGDNHRKLPLLWCIRSEDYTIFMKKVVWLEGSRRHYPFTPTSYRCHHPLHVAANMLIIFDSKFHIN